MRQQAGNDISMASFARQHQQLATRRVKLVFQFHAGL